MIMVFLLSKESRVHKTAVRDDPAINPHGFAVCGLAATVNHCNTWQAMECCTDLQRAPILQHIPKLGQCCTGQSCAVQQGRYAAQVSGSVLHRCGSPAPTLPAALPLSPPPLPPITTWACRRHSYSDTKGSCDGQLGLLEVFTLCAPRLPPLLAPPVGWRLTPVLFGGQYLLPCLLPLWT